MRYVSEQFKEIQGELVRPALQMYFEVDTNIANEFSLAVDSGSGQLNLDYDYTPIVPPKTCTNQHFYAVLGDEIGVDDPNRICAPAIPNGVGTYNMPDGVSVPYGVTIYRRRNYEAQIGVSTPYYENFNGFFSPATLSFKGGLIPEQVRVMRYDTTEESWVEETVISNTEMKEEITFTAEDNFMDFRMFLPKNTQKPGRYQFNWIKAENGYQYNPPRTPIVFENNIISNINITQETDLTSQSLPSYEMSVECLDVDEIYTPESDYFKNQFKDGTPCFLKVGYEINGEVEYIPFMFGRLTKAPAYSEGKLTFDVAVDFCTEWNVEFSSLVDRDLNTGDEVLSSGLVGWITQIFDTYNIFKDQDDEDASVTNYYGEVEQDNAGQLIANALGGYITAGINTVDLHSTIDVQYKPVSNAITRYEQIQATLESQPKVGKIVVTRNENTLSGTNTYQTTLSERVYIHANEEVDVLFPDVPFYAIGKFVVNDYQKSVASAVVGTYYTWLDENINEEGKINVVLTFYSDVNVYIQPIVTFYGVENKQFKETSYHEDGEGELYENDNELVTNSHLSGKVKSVAKMINDVSNQYEVDVIQDFRYELGDIIRLETKQGTYKTCIITGLNFVMPGSSGHLTCKKIFSVADVSVAREEAVGATITFPDDDITLTILETNGKPVVIGKCYNPDSGETTYLMLNVKRYKTEREGEEPVISSTILLVIDNNDEGWEMCFFTDEVGDAEIPTGCLALPDYSSGYGVLPIAFSGISMVEKVYADQDMTAPVDFTCEVDYVPVT